MKFALALLFLLPLVSFAEPGTELEKLREENALLKVQIDFLKRKLAEFQKTQAEYSKVIPQFYLKDMLIDPIPYSETNILEDSRSNISTGPVP